MYIHLLLVCLASLSSGQKLKDSIYTEIEEIRPCFRRLNGTNEIGCTSNIGGNVGVVLYLKEEQDLNKVSDSAFAPYIVLIDPYMFSGALLESLKSSGNVNGVILPSVTEGLWEGHYPKSGYSDDSTCPNSATNNSSCINNNPWNPSGSSAMWVDWGFPIFLVQNTNATEKLYNCFVQYNDKSPLSWPLCSMELKANMYGAKDSQTCIRRSNLFNITPLTVCDPLSDNNIHYFVSPRNGTTPSNQTKVQSEESVIVVSARLDALSLFDQVEVGFETPVTGIVTLLTTAHLVSQAMKTLSYKAGVENVLFLLIHGESFDYIGSSRLVYDMENQAFPFNKSKAEQAETYYSNGTQSLFTKPNIKTFIELGQLSNSQESNVYMHSMNNPKEVVDALRANKGSLSTMAVNGIPPASVQSFLKQSAIPSVVLTNFENEFSNTMYHSIYDSADFHQYDYALGEDQKVVRHLAQVSKMVAKAIISLATGQIASGMQDQGSLINEMLNCYTITANCTLFHEASEPGNYPWIFTPDSRRKTPFPQYVGVRSSYHTLMTKLLLQYLTGTPEPLDTEDSNNTDITEAKKDCLAKNQNQNVYRFVFLVGEACYTNSGVECGKCYKTTVDTTEAASPAFLDGVMEDYDWSSGKYPTWTESIWKVISGRLFLQGSPAHDHGIFAMGIIILGLSLVAVFWLDKNSAVIFTQQKTVEVDNPVPVDL